MTMENPPVEDVVPTENAGIFTNVMLVFRLKYYFPNGLVGNQPPEPQMTPWGFILWANISFPPPMFLGGVEDEMGMAKDGCWMGYFEVGK